MTTEQKTHYRACHLCEAICGLEIVTQGDEVISIKGDKNDPLSRGHVCPKAVALQDLHADPDRLRKPMKRLRDQGDGSEWIEISWQEALDTTAQKLVEIRQQYGDNSLGVYLGNPAVHNYGMLTHPPVLFKQLKTQNRFSATSVDQLPHHLSGVWFYGHKDLITIPDIDNTDYFLILGGNPLASNGSLMTVPDVRKRLKAIQARGGKVVTIDPRRSETADISTEHHFIKPGTDAVLLLALLNVMFEKGLTKHQGYGDWVEGVDAVKEVVKPFTAAVAAKVTGMDVNAIVDIATSLAQTEKAACYGRMGVSVQAFGALCHWAIQNINIVAGNLDKLGGVMFPLPAVDTIPNSNPGGFARFHSRVRGLPEFNGELPSATLAEEILTEGEGQIKVLFTGAGNPVLSTPNGAQLDRALESLEFMVSVDPYLNETTRHADIILPPTSPLEHDHYDLAFHGLAVRNTTRYNPPVFDKPEGSLHDYEIFTALGERVAALLGNEPKPRSEPKDVIALGLAYGPYGEQQGHELGLTLDKVQANPSGIDLGELQPCLPARLKTADQKIHCDQPLALDDIDRLWSEIVEPGQQDKADNELLLIGRRHVRSCNSWMHNYKRLVKGKDRCTLMINPADASKLSLQDGGSATVTSRINSVDVTVEVTEELMPGVVSLPHGWGHNRKGIRMAIAVEHAGVSVNDLTDDMFVDKLSGNAAVNGVPVAIKAAG